MRVFGIITPEPGAAFFGDPATNEYENGVKQGVAAERARIHALAEAAITKRRAGDVPFSIHGEDVLRGLLREVDDPTSEERA